MRHATDETKRRILAVWDAGVVYILAILSLVIVAIYALIITRFAFFNSLHVWVDDSLTRSVYFLRIFVIVCGVVAVAICLVSFIHLLDDQVTSRALNREMSRLVVKWEFPWVISRRQIRAMREIVDSGREEVSGSDLIDDAEGRLSPSVVQVRRVIEAVSRRNRASDVEMASVLIPWLKEVAESNSSGAMATLNARLLLQELVGHNGSC